MRLAVSILAFASAILGIIGVFVLTSLVSQRMDTPIDGGESDLANALMSRLLVPTALAIVTLIGGIAVYAGLWPWLWGLVFIGVAALGLSSAGGFYIVGAALAFIAGILAFFIRSPREGPGSI